MDSRHTSDNEDYRVAANKSNVMIKRLKNQRREQPTESVRYMSKRRIFTMLVMKWLAARRYNVESGQAERAICNYMRAAHTRVVDELFLLKYYRYGQEDLNKYKEQFKEVFKYDLETV